MKAVQEKGGPERDSNNERRSTQRKEKEKNWRKLWRKT